MSFGTSLWGTQSNNLDVYAGSPIGSWDARSTSFLSHKINILRKVKLKPKTSSLSSSISIQQSDTMKVVLLAIVSSLALSGAMAKKNSRRKNKKSVVDPLTRGLEEDKDKDEHKADEDSVRSVEFTIC